MAAINPEQILYEEVWQDTAYRISSPGMRMVPDFLSQLPVGKDDTIMDVGCGTGKAVAALNDKGYKEVSGCDIAENSKNVELRFPFYVYDISRHTPEYRYDWIFCCDVLEHLPPTDIDYALWWIDQSMDKGGYFQIAMFPDNSLPEFKGQLHKNVQDGQYWVNKFREVFEDEYLLKWQDDGRRIVLTLREKIICT